MLLLRLKRLIGGYVVLQVTSPFLERFFNRLYASDFYLWDIRKKNENCATFRVLLADWPRLQELASQMGAQIRLVRKIGLCALWDKIRHRKVFVFGCAAAVCCYLYLSSFVWTVSFYGLRTLKEPEVRNWVYASGIREMMLKKDVDIDRFSMVLLKNYPEIASVQVHMNGSQVLVQIEERDAPIRIYDRDIPIDLVASENGTVDELVVYTGIPRVKKGQKVKKGALLISGTIPFEKGGETKRRKSHALGKIRSYKNKEISGIIINIYRPNPNAEAKKEYTFYVGKGEFNLKSRHSGAKDQVVVRRKNKKLAVGWLSLPLTYDQSSWYNKSDCRKKTEKEIYDEVYRQVKKRIMDKEEILSLSYETTPLDYHQILVTAKVKYAKNIAEEKKIP